MKYQIEGNIIKIFSKEEFNPEHILECGQVFCYRKDSGVYIAFPGNECCRITEEKECYILKTTNPSYFVKWFDLDNDYQEIKRKLGDFSIMKNPIEFGYGIRILKQDLFETLISFIISANNNIKRIKLILNNLRINLGEKIVENVYSFPTYENLSKCDEDFFKEMGAGYRASYLVKVCKQVNPQILEKWRELPTKELRNNLISLSGIGPKVADCILLFGYNRQDVFPVDTWIAKMHNQYFEPIENREKIRNNLVGIFKELSGYAQQYLFYYQRSAQN